MDFDETRLVLFLTRATSLSKWKQLGILDRELTIYNKLSTKLKNITFLSHGGNEELLFNNINKKFTILANRNKIPPNLYSILAPFINKSILLNAEVYKTNQLDGAWTAIIAGSFYDKPVIVRAGYLWSENYRKAGGKGLKAWVIKQLQTFSLNKADLILVTTKLISDHIISAYKVTPEKIRIIPNYVDTDIFKPQPSMNRIPGRLCFVGRLHPDKNLVNLLKAMVDLSDLSLVIIGDGEQRQQLENLVKSLNLQVTFLGIIENSRIPFEINHSQIFILPSLYEGHSKVLLEAMACGLPVIGTDVEGIHEEITHGENGWLCSTDSGSIRNAIIHVISDYQLQMRLGNNAREHVLRNYSIKNVVELELHAIQEACRNI